MANEIRPEDIRRIAAQKEREVFGESGRRRYVDARMDFSPQPPLAPSDSLPPLAADPRARGPYDRAGVGVEPALELNVDADDDDLGLPPSYSPTDYSRDEEYFEEERPRRRRWLPMSVALLALLGFAGVVWYAYDWSSTGGRRGQVPIIQASAVEEKTKPANEAGMQVPNQESTVLNPQSEKPVEEVLMPPPEEPVVVFAPAPQPDDEPVVVLTPAAPPAPPPPAATGSAQPSGSDTIAAIIAAETAPQAPAAATAATSPSVPATPQPPAATPAASSAVALPAPSPASGPVIPAGAFLIQLASLTSAEAAEKTWVSLQRKHAVLLGDMALNVQKAEIDGKGTYFRVQAGPLPNRATADDMCAQLKAAQQDCIVVKR
jgi:hypothetical protein